jgi:hypothetical protein
MAVRLSALRAEESIQPPKLMGLCGKFSNSCPFFLVLNLDFVLVSSFSSHYLVDNILKLWVTIVGHVVFSAIFS